MALNEQHKSLIKSFAVGAVAGLLVVYVASQFIQRQDTPPLAFREAPAENKRPTPEELPAGDMRVSYAAAVEAAAPAVVNIHTAKVVSERPGLMDDPFFRRFFGDQGVPQRRLPSLGSGVLVSEEGYILTNHHVTEEADEIRVALRDGRSTNARVVGSDPESDLAVLKIDLADLPVITMGHSDQLYVGDVVLAIGNPFGVGQTVTMGIVSATGRDRLGISTFENFIQTDAAINPGNSGGALVNAYGHLVGINTAIFSRSGGSQGIGFAIPVSIAKDVAQQIIQHGHAVRGWLGIEIQDVTPELAESFGLNEASGVIVAGVLKDGPGHQAGLRPGDVILRIEGEVVEDSRQAMNTIAAAAPGTEIPLTVTRRGEERRLKATAGQRPLPEAQR